MAGVAKAFLLIPNQWGSSSRPQVLRQKRFVSFVHKLQTAGRFPGKGTVHQSMALSSKSLRCGSPDETKAQTLLEISSPQLKNSVPTMSLYVEARVECMGILPVVL